MDDECRCELCVWYPPAPEPIPSITGNLEEGIPMTKAYDPSTEWEPPSPDGSDTDSLAQFQTRSGDLTAKPERPAAHTVDIELNNAAHGRIAVDGQDVQDQVVGFTVFATPGRGPQVVLELTGSFRLASDVASVEIEAETAHLLRRLGWTPPAAPKLPVASERTDVQD